MKHNVLKCNEVRHELSAASDGNFLECLNMSLHIFEKHHTDRSLHRTGQMILVISAGVGIFDVDHSGKNFDKNSIQHKKPTEALKTSVVNRIRDLGVGCDLVCLGEQPLHAVPLFRIIVSTQNDGRYEYEKPDFINLNYYRDSPITIDENMANISYVPRIGLQYVRSGSTLSRSNSMPTSAESVRNREDRLESPKFPQTREEMEEYDNKIFESKIVKKRATLISKPILGKTSSHEPKVRI